MRALKLMRLAVPIVVFLVAPLYGGNCRWINEPTAVAFGTYSVFGTVNSASTSTFDLRCNPNTSGRVTLSTGGAGTFTPRRMASGGNTADYNLYLDPAGVTIWGDNSGGTVFYEIFNGTPGDKTFTDFIYGIVPFGQDLAPGTYTDTVFATLSWNNGAGSRPPVAVAISMTVNPECRVDAFNLNFGAYNPFSVIAINQTSLLRVYCTRTTVANVVLNNGSFPLGLQKRMREGGGTFLNYNAALPVTSGTSTSSLVPVAAGFNVNGTVPSSQDAIVANYLDTLIATVNY
jgi:spore coat protein U domain-containing protein, fimbrial subunit CupE1/2/3/6